ncbi:hypothetical protein CRG98_019971 [Punica granatum]|uniref:Uncharacterized protein n=1 Tax=Punica granatum TaxID=22663 RepID=A0A2I0JTK8_PUNGR|nr:hypothetical protein CRG98_019971 [Punica granatum]
MNKARESIRFEAEEGPRTRMVQGSSRPHSSKEGRIDPFREGGGRPSLGWAKGTHGSLPRDLTVSSMAQSVAKGASPARI